MLHCNMNISPSLQLDLEDLLADLQHARRSGDLGRMALLCYCEVRRWARKAGQTELAELSAAMITGSPHGSREAFLADMDRLVRKLEALQYAMQQAERKSAEPTPAQRQTRQGAAN
jgi:hypothetical protein